MMHRLTSRKGIDLIKRFEGLSLTPYLCQGGYVTIGYGHKLKSGEAACQITHLQAEHLFKQDLFLCEKSVIRLINVPLSDNQFNALVSFTYNLGAASLQRSILRQKINHKEYAEASEEFMRWIYVSGKVSAGLTRRRIEERKLYGSCSA